MTYSGSYGIIIIIMRIHFCILFVFILLFFSSCNIFVGDKKSSHSNQPENPELQPEEILEPTDDYFLDLKKLGVSEEEGDSYDKESFILNLVTKWKCAQIWLGDYDASLYRYVRIEYEPVTSEENQPFRFHSRYSDNTSSYQLCERKRTVQYLPLDKGKKNSLKSVFIQSITDKPLTVKIKSICFTQNKILTPAIVDSNGNAVIKSISAVDLVDKMGVGWNLANTFEAHSFSWQENPLLQGLESEFHWESIETTPELLQFAFDKGYKTLRVPVTWYCHIIDDNYTIDPDWMARVKVIVDEALKIGYYVILNEHHSVHGDHKTEYVIQENGTKKFTSRAMGKPLNRGEGYLVCSDEADIKESKRFLHAIWKQIATAFNTSYDEHLVFETMNEPRNARDEHKADPKGRTDHEWQPGLKMPWYKEDGSIGGYWCDATNCEECIKEYEVLNQYNQVCLNAIRATGGNNANRFVIIPSPCTGQKTVVNEMFHLPQDSAVDKLILSVHSYPFGSSEDGTKENQKYTDAMKQATKDTVENLYRLFVLGEGHLGKGLPIVYGEVGAVRSKVAVEERIKWIDLFVKEARAHKMSVLYWDCGDDRSGSMAQIDREHCTLYEPDFFYTMINAAK